MSQNKFDKLTKKNKRESSQTQNRPARPVSAADPVYTRFNSQRNRQTGKAASWLGGEGLVELEGVRFLVGYPSGKCAVCSGVMDKLLTYRRGYLSTQVGNLSV